MSTKQLLKSLAGSLVILGMIAGTAGAATLKPFKDDLFSYGTILETADGGAYEVVDYDEMRDINGRDQIPERRVKRAYVALGVKADEVDETIGGGGRPVPVTRVGRERDAAFTVIFIHGRGGDRRLGTNDYSFGGNFNRLKNLADGNGGAYYSASVASFDSEGVADIAGLIGAVRSRSPGKPVVLACASMGSFICWGIAKDKGASADLAGMMIMGGATDPDFAKSPAAKAKLPLFFSHGGSDSVYAADQQVALYQSLQGKGYPTRLVLFRNGSHGTPVRMTDWRDALNWIFDR